MQMTQLALLMVHRVELTVLAYRSYRYGQYGRQLRVRMPAFGLRYRLTDSGKVTLQDALDTLQALPGHYQSALNVWDGHHTLMAQVNKQLGACDISPADAARALDKLAALSTAHGSFHVELLHGTNGRWELVEVNARPGWHAGVRKRVPAVRCAAQCRLCGRADRPRACGLRHLPAGCLSLAWPRHSRLAAAVWRAQARRLDEHDAGWTAWRRPAARTTPTLACGTPSGYLAAEVGLLAAADYIDFQYSF